VQILGEAVDLRQMMLDAVRDGYMTKRDLKAFDAAAEAQRLRNLQWEHGKDVARAKAGAPKQYYAGRTPGELPDEPIPLGPPSDHQHNGTEMWNYSEANGKLVVLHDHGIGYRCTRCRDCRWVRHDVTVGHHEFGKVFPCSCVIDDPVWRRTIQERRLERSGIPGELLDCTLDSFQVIEGTEHAMAAVRTFLDAHRTGSEHLRFLALYGAPGRGKTHLLIAALQPILLLSDVFASTAGAFLQECKANQFELDVRLTQAAIETPVLCLDEVGSQVEGDWGREKIERILNARLEHKRWTLLGFTADIDEIKAWSPRIGSRMSDKQVVARALLSGPDYRTIKSVE
jgi:DNA replication protein DnaC